MLKRQSGFTVIEILIGIALFGLVMPAIIIAVVNVSRINDRAADLSRANMIAEVKAESLRSAGFNVLNDGTVNFAGELDKSFTEPRDAYYTVSTPEAGVKEIDITIQYTDAGQTRELTYSSIISELGVAQ